MTSERLTAGARMERLLSIVPWVVANDGPSLSEIADRFDYPQRDLLSDLTEVLFMVGTYPYTPDRLVEVIVEDDRVWIHYAEYFARPLRLTPHEALALVTASSGLLSVPGADPDGPLARGLDKLAGTLGIEPGAELSVDLGTAPVELIAQIRESISACTQLNMEYYTYGRDETTVRLINPYQLTSSQGQWYLLAYCTIAEGERLFRLDRMGSVESLESEFTPPTEQPDVSLFEARASDPRVTLLLEQSAAWVPEAFPAESVEEIDNGRLRVVMAISAMPWLERLLLRLGPEAEVEAVDGDMPRDIAAEAALRVLERYDH
jgi:proteasome accessory factor C